MADMPFTLSGDTNYPENFHIAYTSYKLVGIITSTNGNITTVNGGIFDKDGNRIYGKTVTVNSTTFDISKIDDAIAFRNLGIGEYYYRITAKNSGGTYDVINYLFTVVADYNSANMKSNGEWVKGTAFVKINGVWKQAMILVKSNGKWKLGD